MTTSTSRAPSRAGSRRLHTRREPVDRDRLAAAAVGLADAEGIDAVTMRRLGSELGVTAMAAYRHVTDRQDLVLAMLDQVAGEAVVPPSDLSPRETLEAAAAALRDVFEAHPWIIELIAAQGLASERILPLIDAMFGALRRAGLDLDAAIDAYSLLVTYLYGYAMTRRQPTDSYGRRLVRAADPDRFPHLAEVIGASGGEPPDRFDVNLAAVLDAILPSPA